MHNIKRRINEARKAIIKRHRLFHGEDFTAAVRLAESYVSTYPAQTIVGVDHEMRPCVTLHFDDFKGNLDFVTIFFSSVEVAGAAFSLLEVLDRVAYGDDDIAESNDDELPF